MSQKTPQQIIGEQLEAIVDNSIQLKVSPLVVLGLLEIIKHDIVQMLQPPSEQPK